jgi:hypothetical protein
LSSALHRHALLVGSVHAAIIHLLLHHVLVRRITTHLLLRRRREGRVLLLEGLRTVVFRVVHSSHSRGGGVPHALFAALVGHRRLLLLLRRRRVAALWRLGWWRVAFPLSRRHVSVAVGFGFGGGDRWARGGFITRPRDGREPLLFIPILQLSANIVPWRVFDFTRDLGGSGLSLSAKDTRVTFSNLTSSNFS